MGTMLSAGLGACPAVLGEATNRFAWTRAVPCHASQVEDGRPTPCSPRRRGAKGLSPAPALIRTLGAWVAFFYLCLWAFCLWQWVRSQACRSHLLGLSSSGQRAGLCGLSRGLWPGA